jgi:hypothetical protein
MAKELMSMLTAQSTKETGRTINRTEEEYSTSQTVTGMRGISRTEREQVEESTTMPLGTNTRGIIGLIKGTAKGSCCS